MEYKRRGTKVGIRSGRNSRFEKVKLLLKMMKSDESMREIIERKLHWLPIT
jgi:hypothetical protein